MLQFDPQLYEEKCIIIWNASNREQFYYEVIEWQVALTF